MNKTKMLINCAILIAGLCLVGYSAHQRVRSIVVQSDFRAFAARVASDEKTRHVLSYGGEKEGTGFNYLLTELSDLSGTWRHVVHVGLLLSLLSAIALIIELTTKKNQKSIK